MFALGFAPELTSLLHDQQRLQSKACNLTRLMPMIATIILAAALLFCSPSDFRMGVCIVLLGAAAILVVSQPRHGDSGALRGFAGNLWKIYQSVGA